MKRINNAATKITRILQKITTFKAFKKATTKKQSVTCTKKKKKKRNSYLIIKDKILYKSYFNGIFEIAIAFNKANTQKKSTTKRKITIS